VKIWELMSLVGRFVQADDRLRAGDELAHWLGVDQLLVYLRDPELEILLPAPGFPQTVSGGPAWRAFLRTAAHAGTHRAEVDYRAGELVQATAIATTDGTAIILLGASPHPIGLAALHHAAPLIGSLVRAEHAALIARAEARVAQVAGLQATDLAVALDVTRRELESALSESARLNAELTDIGRRKDDFLAMLGHELRNPIAAISAAQALLRELVDAGDHPQVARARDIIDRQLAHLGRLVDDLLDVARVTRGKVELQFERLDTADIIRRAIEATQALFDAKRHAIRLDVRDALFVRADRTRFEQMVMNLLTNAAKYTDPGGSIVVEIARDGNEATIAVEDNGIGIPAVDLPRIFDAFLQVSPSIDRAAGGLGVGLTVASQLAKLHGGRIDARSEVGKGSRFTLRLPALEEAPEVAAAVEPTPAPARCRVLVVDDNEDSAEMLVALLEQWGHEAFLATEGTDAVTMARDLHPDIVLLDIGLPGMDGYAVAGALRGDPTTRDTRIVAVSGYGLESDRSRAFAAGFDEHLVKPVDLSRLRHELTAVERHL
jgi:signal transduction histidine kinase/CheY-like chemotaxis protein